MSASAFVCKQMRKADRRSRRRWREGDPLNRTHGSTSNTQSKFFRVQLAQFGRTPSHLTLRVRLEGGT